jgi:hypothetical protein
MYSYKRPTLLLSSLMDAMDEFDDIDDVDELAEILYRLDALEDNAVPRGAGGPHRRGQGRHRGRRFNPYGGQRAPPVGNFIQVVTDAIAFAIANPWTTLGIISTAAYAMGRSPVRICFDIAFALMPTVPMPRMPAWRLWPW